MGEPGAGACAYVPAVAGQLRRAGAGPTRLGVLGWPVAHSRSPAMQNAALRLSGLHDWRYQLLPVPPALFDETVVALPGAGFRAANVTIPHKLAALALATRPTARARAVGAANVLLFTDGEVVADNTDAPALTAALPFDPNGRTALVLGTGGSARAAVWALLHAGAEVHVLSRSPARARAFCDELGAAPAQRIIGADLLVNCTPAGLHVSGGRPELPLAESALAHFSFVADFVYREGGTPLLHAARARGIGAIDGLELLVEQGALSFELFTGRPAPVSAMRTAAGLSSL